MSDKPTTIDQPFYYLDHFKAALKWIDLRYGDLLSVVERSFIENFAHLPRASQALLVRLVMRKGALFRISKLCYPEIGDLHAAFENLIRLGWVDPRPDMTIDQLFKLATRAELINMFGKSAAEGSKAAALARLQPHFVESRRFDQWTREPGEQVLLISIAPLCIRLRLLYFGNFDQEWREFVLAELGVFNYESVSASLDSRAFESRADIEHFFALYDCRCDFNEGKSPAEIQVRLRSIDSTHEWLKSRREKLFFRIAREHERLGSPDDALASYLECRHPGARVRAVRLLEAAARHSEALKVAMQALAAPESEAEVQALNRIKERLERRQLPRCRRQRRDSLPRMDLQVPMPREGSSVERLVLGKLSRPEAPVFFVENALINSLFGLLCWDVLFAPIRGAFFHPFQAGPADLFSPSFFGRRQSLFQAAFGRLMSGDYQQAITATFHRKQNVRSHFVSWSLLSESLLSIALSCLPAAHLKSFFERLVTNLRDNRSGLPDLIQFWPAEQRYRMIEVKGPRDRLQDNQRRWIDYCLERDLPVSVCYATWEERA